MTTTLKQAKDLEAGDVVHFGHDQADRKVASVAIEGDFVRVTFDDKLDGGLAAAATSKITVTT